MNNELGRLVNENIEKLEFLRENKDDNADAFADFIKEFKHLILSYAHRPITNYSKSEKTETNKIIDPKVKSEPNPPDIGGILQRFTTKTGRTPKPLLKLFQKHGKKLAAGDFTLARLRIEDPLLAKAVEAYAQRQGVDVGDILPTGDLVKPGRKAKEPEVDPDTLDPNHPVEGLLRQKILAEQERRRRQATDKAQRRKIRNLSMDK